MDSATEFLKTTLRYQNMENYTFRNESQANVTQAIECNPFSSAHLISEKALMITGYTVQFILSIAGNVLVIVVFCKSHQLQKVSVNLFIVNVAVSDLLVPLCVIPRRVQEVFLGWSPWLVDGVLGDILCKVVNFADEVSVAVSSVCMVFIAVERFWSIVFWKKDKVISRKNTPKLIAFTWIFSCLFYSFYFFVYKLTESKTGISCKYGLPQFFDTWEDLWRVDRLATFTVFGILPFIAITAFYAAIAVKLLRQKDVIATQVPSAAERKREKDKKRTIIMLVTLVLIFFIAWTPHYVFVFNHYFQESKWSCKSRRKLYIVIKFFSYIYTVLNPMIYYLFIKRYRQELKKILCNLSCSCFRRETTSSYSTRHANTSNQHATFSDNFLSFSLRLCSKRSDSLD